MVCVYSHSLCVVVLGAREDDPQEALSEVLETLQAHIQKRGGGGLVTVGDVEAVVTMMSRDDEDQLAERLQVR